MRYKSIYIRSNTQNWYILLDDNQVLNRVKSSKVIDNMQICFEFVTDKLYVRFRTFCNLSGRVRFRLWCFSTLFWVRQFWQGPARTTRNAVSTWILFAPTGLERPVYCTALLHGILSRLSLIWILIRACCKQLFRQGTLYPHVCDIRIAIAVRTVPGNEFIVQ